MIAFPIIQRQFWCHLLTSPTLYWPLRRRPNSAWISLTQHHKLRLKLNTMWLIIDRRWMLGRSSRYKSHRQTLSCTWIRSWGRISHCRATISWTAASAHRTSPLASWRLVTQMLIKCKCCFTVWVSTSTWAMTWVSCHSMIAPLLSVQIPRPTLLRSVILWIQAPSALRITGRASTRRLLPISLLKSISLHAMTPLSTYRVWVLSNGMDRTLPSSIRTTSTAHRVRLMTSLMVWLASVLKRPSY